MYSIEYLLYYKFNSAHFICHEDEREELHGHNYKVSVEIFAENLDSNSNQIINQIEFHQVMNNICQGIKHRLLLGSENKNCIFEETDENIILLSKCDQKFFSIPKGDVLFLKIPQISAEYLAMYINNEVYTFRNKYEYENVRYRKFIIKVYEDVGKSSSYIRYIS